MPHISGKQGNVYSSALLVDDGETAWAPGANVTATADTAVFKVGAKSAKLDIAAAAGVPLICATIDWAAKDLSTYDGIYWWARASVAGGTVAGGFQLLLDHVAACAGDPHEALNLPALTQNTWKQCFTRLAAPVAGIISVGLKMVTDYTTIIYLDDIEALKDIEGIKSWTLDYTADTLETTDFGSAGVKDYIIGGSGWSGSFEGFKEGVPLGIGAEVYLTLGESLTAYQNWIGKVIITGASPNTSHDGIVSYSYTYQGTGALEVPSA